MKLHHLKEQKQIAIEIIHRLRENGFVSYFAGGCVRDVILKKKAKDYDIATTATPDEVENLFPKSIPVGKQFGVVIIVEGDFHFEVATFRREGPYGDGRHPDAVSYTNPEEDAKRRDFTINGLFYDPIRKRVIDYVEGKRDLRKRVIRTIGDPDARFEEDRLRLLRAVRFSANLNFRIEQSTWEAIKRLRKGIHLVSPERIRDELTKMFTRPNAGLGLELLSESGLLAEVLLEVEAMKGIKQPPEFHPEGDVFVHTKMLMDQLKDASTVLAFGALLHDVGKPPTFAEDGGKIHFYSHAKKGGEMAREILTRLKFSNREISDIVSCVDNHMKFADVKQMRVGKLKQFMARENFPQELELHRIDCLASHGKLDLFRFLKGRARAFQREELRPKRILTGDDLIQLGMRPGPLMKEILGEAYALQLEGKIRSVDEAREWVKAQYLK